MHAAVPTIDTPPAPMAHAALVASPSSTQRFGDASKVEPAYAKVWVEAVVARPAKDVAAEGVPHPLSAAVTVRPAGQDTK